MNWSAMFNDTDIFDGRENAQSLLAALHRVLDVTSLPMAPSFSSRKYFKIGFGFPLSISLATISDRQSHRDRHDLQSDKVRYRIYS